MHWHDKAIFQMTKSTGQLTANLTQISRSAIRIGRENEQGVYWLKRSHLIDTR